MDLNDKWQKEWDRVRNSPEFNYKVAPKKKNVTSFFGGYDMPTDGEYGEVDVNDASYWDNVYDNSVERSITVLNEEKKEAVAKSGKKPIKQKKGKDDPSEKYPDPAGKAKCSLPGEKYDGDTLADVGKHLGKQVNPIQYPSRGKDARKHVTPNFTCGKELVELHNMKKALSELESKLGSARALAKNKEVKKIKTQIDDLWDKIDELSDKLSPDFLTDYMS